ncbi:MAG: 4Fe-4S ferredoxin [Candidatus Glassbacteria bacterium]|nr:4Fe-4S ferredoxin [Candidatus Glassbacteria bacterium]
MVREIIKIDEELCNGCGDCVTSCAEGAIQIIDGKAKLVSETYCDGLGACIGDCPTGALTIEEREADEFDEEAVEQHLGGMKEKQKIEDIVSRAMGHKPAGGHGHAPAHGGGGCPGSMSRMFEQAPDRDPAADELAPALSRLGNWPVQLMLAPINAPCFAGADLLISADCAPFAHANFHGEFIKGKTVLIGCPKLDDSGHYQDKLTRIFGTNSVKSVEVLFMEVPCCFGLASLVQSAIADSGRQIPLKHTKIGVRGDVVESGEA